MKLVGRLLGVVVVVASGAGCTDLVGNDQVTSGTGGSPSAGAGGGLGGHGSGGGTGGHGGGSGGMGGHGGGCTVAAECPATGSACVLATCTGGVCGTENAKAGTVVMKDMPADCQDTACDGMGHPTMKVADDTNVPVDPSPCVVDTCAMGVKGMMNAAARTACDTGGMLCDGMGNCVACLVNGDCQTMTEACSAAHTCEPVLGQTCKGIGDCDSGFCVAGICCDTACEGTCQACTAAKTGGMDGTCANIITGLPAPAGQCVAAPPCGNTGACAAGGVCQETASGTACAAATCAGGMATPASTCDGTGNCAAPSPASCSPYANCDGTICASICAKSSDCAIGPCNACPMVTLLCLAPLTIGDCKGGLCNPGNPRTCGPLGTFAVGTQPVAIAFDGTNMWVANYGSNNVTKLSPSGATLGTFAVGDGPMGIAFDGTNMWVTNAGSNNVTKLSPTGTPLGTFAVGDGPWGIAFDGTNMWVANDGNGNVTKLSPTGTALGTFAVGEGPLGIAFDGTSMWVVNQDSETVTKLSTAGAALGTFAVGNLPWGIAFDGTNMWVVNANSDTITKLSPTGVALGTFAAGGGPLGIAFDGTNMWVTGTNNVTEVSPMGAALGTFAVGSGPSALAFDGEHMWVANEYSNNVTDL
jgi:DNA-binding beta-propeller fold protein YncE